MHKLFLPRRFAANAPAIIRSARREIIRPSARQQLRPLRNRMMLMGVGATDVAGGGGGGGFSAPALTATGTPHEPAYSGSTFTWTGLAIGTADANRWVIAAICGYLLENTANVTIGGVSATKITGVWADNYFADLWIANVPTGTTANVVVTFTTNQGWGANVALFRMVKATSTTHDIGTPISPAFATANMSDCTVPSGGAAIFCGVNDDTVGGGATGITGTGLIDIYSATYYQIGHSTTAGTNTATITSAGGGSEKVGLVGASWGP